MKSDEVTIRDLVDDSAQAVRTKDIDALMSNFVPDVLSFDAESGRASVGLRP